MTELLYQKDSYLREIEASVTSVDGKSVEFDHTIFYPASGGQMCDTGTVTNGDDIFSIISVSKKDGKILHELDRDGLSVGDSVHCKIDWNRRYMMMRMHTAAHIISAVLNKGSGALITGNQLGIEKSRIDFSVEKIDRELAQKFIDRANDIIERDFAVTSYTVNRDQLDESMMKLAKGFPENMQTFRIVQIGDFDRQADGGTHLRSTRDVGKIVLLGIENKGKLNRRIYFALQ
jgi:Ser-tRNA(Ala) deacylase AlaX